ncbi:ankyrin repeat domain-containing protein [uncultured Lacinutrix sp.]|uniref:ankyrin repeat domain-containing protein n=1 Tax=uncultured Lacinutrix sp. TaxID=574032 RepID=UPI00263929E2|nr:ankyrin repeat domain-containing protein [uncultured Lacinutrix sp.]
MTISRQIIGLLCAFISITVYAQEPNIFLDRAYWKTNPSVQDIKLKIKEGNNPSELNASAFDATSLALIEKVDNETIKFLLNKKGNDVNKLTHDGRTYIFWAAYRGNLEIMDYLVRKGAKTDVVDSHGYSMLNFAAVTGQSNTKIYDFCIANGSNIKEEKNHDGANALLLVAPFIKDIKLLDYFLTQGLDINSVDNKGNGIFNYTAKNGNIEIMKRLIHMKVLFNSPNKDGGNAMIFASQGTRRNVNAIETFKYLESLGINPNVTTNNGVTPLHALAYKSKDINVFDYFISKGVNVNQTNEDGNTAFLNAAYNNDIEIVKHLEKHIEDINTKNKEGKSALTNAISRNTIAVAKFLIKKGADITVKDKEGNTLMYYILKHFNSDKIEEFNKKLELLKSKGLNPKAIQTKGNTLYHVALDKNNLELLKRVHEMGIDVNIKNDDKISPLHKAVMKAKDDVIIKYLISIGADKTAKTNFNETVYDLAKENELLKQQNIDINFLK